MTNKTKKDTEIEQTEVYCQQNRKQVMFYKLFASRQICTNRGVSAHIRVKQILVTYNKVLITYNQVWVTYNQVLVTIGYLQPSISYLQQSIAY